jgi:arogenate dehydrogenase (NADP+)
MKIGIVGLGLIGASLAGDLRQLGHQVEGVSRQHSTCEFAVANDLVDRASTDISTLATCEIIIICTPIDKIVPTVSLLAAHLSPETIVTDAGSVKDRSLLQLLRSGQILLAVIPWRARLKVVSQPQN